MFDWLGQVTFQHRRAVLVAATLFLALGATWGTGVFGAMVSGGFDTPGSQSARALDRTESTVGRSDADVIVLYTDGGATVDDAGFRAAVTTHLAGLPRAEVVSATSYWTAGEAAPRYVSHDRRSAYAVLHLRGAGDDELMTSYHEVEAALRDAPAGLTVKLGGTAALSADISDRVSADIGRAESISLPILVVLLVLIFGGLTAAGLPLAIGGLAILGAFTMLRLLALVTTVSIFSVNIVTMLGLGLAIDYGLFIVSRFREQLATGQDTETALRATMVTAGRTVAFSGLTVAISLGSLLFFPQVFLRSMGFGGMAAVLVAMVGALTVLPALLAVLGPRVDSLRVSFLRRRRTAGNATEPSSTGTWARVAHSVMRRPLVYIAVLVPVLLIAGAPFLGVQFGGIDHRALPAGTESRVVTETLLQDFAVPNTTTIDPVVTFIDGAIDASRQAELTAYARRLAALPGVSSAEVTTVKGSNALLSVQHQYSGVSAQARDLVGEIRAVTPPAGGDVLVGGRAAELRDLLASLGATLPWMGLFVLGVTLILLFLAFGSIVLPMKAVVMNALSLSASFGAVVWIFQDGHLSGLLGFTTTGTVEATQPILMLAMAFGLSMDYEVFLLSRVREQWDRTGDNTAAVAGGLQRTGRIITSAALLLIVVIGAFATSGIVFIKMIGVGMVIAILIDATLVRALLVPATMRLLGRWNWWAPAPLAHWWNRHGLRETGDVVAVAASDVVIPSARENTLTRR